MKANEANLLDLMGVAKMQFIFPYTSEFTRGA